MTKEQQKAFVLQWRAKCLIKRALHQGITIQQIREVIERRSE